MNAPFTLFGAPTGNCFRAAIALEEANIPYVVKLVDLRHGEHQSENFLALNPAGKVPVLARTSGESGTALTQSNAIMFYADQLAPGRLAPTVTDAMRAVVMERYFYFLTEVISLSHASFRLRLTGFGDAPALLGRRAVAALAYAENFLTDASWMAGPSFSMADIAAYTACVSYIDEIDWNAVPRLKEWFQRSHARPSIIRGMRAFSGNAGN